MRVKLLLIALAAWYGAAAQEAATASIGGTVRDRESGEPLADTVVVIEPAPGTKPLKTGSDGSYSFKGLAPRFYTLRVSGPAIAGVVWKYVTLVAGQDVTKADFGGSRPAVLAGRVLDGLKNPLPGVKVTVRSEVYFLGTPSLEGSQTVLTNDRGEYRIQGIMPGRPYILVAGLPEVVPITDGVPVAAAKRKLAWQRLYYPDSPTGDGAVPIVLMSGERREGVDFIMRRHASFCVQGTVTGMAGGRMRIETDDPWPGWPVPVGEGLVPASDRFLICDLPKGEYRVLASAPRAEGGGLLAALTFQVSKADVQDLRLVAQRPIQVEGVAAWQTPPEKAPAAKVRVSATPTRRGSREEEIGSVNCEVPGSFVFPSLVVGDEYRLSILGLPADAYVKDVRYAGRSILGESFRPGSGFTGAQIQILLDSDAAVLNLRVVDKDGTPAADGFAVAMPADARTELEFARYIRPYGTDQNGTIAIRGLAPGAYVVFAVDGPFEVAPTPLTIRGMMSLRTKGMEVTLGKGETVSRTIQQKASLR
jgi:Carboxypeptidase regulatory-like domain